jgi:integrase
MDDYDEKRLTRDEIKAWRCACGAGPEEIVWTEEVSYVRKWDGARFASMRKELAQEGVALIDIQQQLGHSSAATTDRYLHQLNTVGRAERLRSRTW